LVSVKPNSDVEIKKSYLDLKRRIQFLGRILNKVVVEEGYLSTLARQLTPSAMRGGLKKWHSE
jgi:hypothetical protein